MHGGMHTTRFTRRALHGGLLEGAQVRGSAATRQISATYAHSEGAAMQIVLQLSACHPLRALEVACSPTYLMAVANFTCLLTYLLTRLLEVACSLTCLTLADLIT